MDGLVRTPEYAVFQHHGEFYFIVPKRAFAAEEDWSEFLREAEGLLPEPKRSAGG
jgi:hypothetical protein